MELEENFNIQEKNRELLQQLKASQEMLRQEREEKAALQREYDRMRLNSRGDPKIFPREDQKALLYHVR